MISTLVFISCKASKSGINTSKQKGTEDYIYNKKEEKNKKVNASKNINIKKEIVETAINYLGVKYKTGGTTKAGMDCSGLVYTTFLNYGIVISRNSIDMAKEGTEVRISKAQKGDLIFFKTGNRKVINHVGIITEIKDGIIFFIHSSSSKGVIISSLKDAYYLKAFVKIKRIIK